MQILNNKDYIEHFLSRSFQTSKSHSTVRSYKEALNKFQKFIKEKYNLDVKQLLFSLENKTLEPISVLDEFYTYLPDCNCSVNTIVGYFSIAKEFLNENGMHIYNEDIKHKIRLPRRTLTYEEGLTREKTARILRNSPPKLQTTILMAVSSGMRIGELVQLRFSDIDFSTTPTSIRIRKETCKTRQTRFTCISDEATLALKDYLRKNHA